MAQAGSNRALNMSIDLCGFEYPILALLGYDNQDPCLSASPISATKVAISNRSLTSNPEIPRDASHINLLLLEPCEEVLPVVKVHVQVHPSKSLSKCSKIHQRVSLQFAQTRQRVVNNRTECIMIGRVFRLLVRERCKADLPH